MNIGDYNYRRLFSKWLIATVLLLGIFTFPPLTQTQSKPVAVQTALQSKGKRRLPSITYNQSLQQTHRQATPPASFTVTEVDLSAWHSGLVKTHFSSNRCCYIANIHGHFFCPAKTIPQTTGDDPDIALA
ncbi:MAG: hypothetical protein ACXVJD_05085 [Mucilaginibacter sp.]